MIALPLPQRIKEVLLNTNGVSLALTHSEFYLVGLDYTPGTTITQWDPRTDFFGSRDLPEAKTAFIRYSGRAPRTNDPNDFQVRDTKGEL